MGHRPSMPDSLPVIGLAPHAPDAFLDFGRGHAGLRSAAPKATLIADLVGGRPCAIGIAPYGAKRLSQASRRVEYGSFLTPNVIAVAIARH